MGGVCKKLATVDGQILKTCGVSVRRSSLHREILPRVCVCVGGDARGYEQACPVLARPGPGLALPRVT